MSSYLRGGTGRAYGFDLENIVKSSSTTSSRTSHSKYSSSPSSILSESSNVISTRKPRTPRKRPNQTYNEAAALLSTACPTIFSITKKSTNNKQSEFPNYQKYFLKEPLDLLLPFPGTKRPIKVTTPRDIEYNGNWNCSSSSCNSIELNEGYQDDFDTESILDEEIEEGIDSIMGNSNSISNDEKSTCVRFMNYDFNSNNTCYGYPIGLGFGGNLEFKFGYGLRNGVRALKNVDEGNWGSFPAVNLINISSSPGSTKLKKTPVEKKKKVEDLMKLEPKLGAPVAKEESNLSLDKAPRLLLKLNYDNVLNAWSDKGSPLPEEILGSESPGGDIYVSNLFASSPAKNMAKLAQIDLFSENGGVREASVNRYKEKRQTRLFSKKIRYQVRKVNADRRPRSKGRFVRRPNPPICEET